MSPIDKELGIMFLLGAGVMILALTIYFIVEAKRTKKKNGNKSKR